MTELKLYKTEPTIKYSLTLIKTLFCKLIETSNAEVKTEDRLQNDAGNIKDEDEEEEEEDDIDDEDEEEAAEEEEEDKGEGEVKEVAAEEKVGFLAVVEEHTNENDQEDQVEEDEEGEEEDDEEEESEPEQFPRFDRERLVREYNKAVAEREALTKRFLLY